MKYDCLAMVALRFAALAAAVTWGGIGPGRALASTIIVLEISDQGGSEISTTDDWHKGLAAQKGLGYDWSKLTHSPDEYFRHVLAPSFEVNLASEDRSADQTAESDGYDEYDEYGEQVASSRQEPRGWETTENEASFDDMAATSTEAMDAKDVDDVDSSYSAAIEEDADNFVGGPEKAFSRYHYAAPEDRYADYRGAEPDGEPYVGPDYASDMTEGREATEADAEYADEANTDSTDEYADETDSGSTNEYADKMSGDSDAEYADETDSGSTNEYADKMSGDSDAEYADETDSGSTNEYADETNSSWRDDYASETGDNGSYDDPSYGYEEVSPQAKYGSQADDAEDDEDELNEDEESDEMAPWIIETPAQTAAEAQRTAASNDSEDSDDGENWEDESSDNESGDSMYDNETPESMEPATKNPYSYDYSTIREKYAYGVEGGEEAANDEMSAADEDESSAADDEDEDYEDEDYEGMEQNDEDAPATATPSAASTEKSRESGVELFAWQPSELLILPDQDLIKTLANLGEGEWEARREALQDYVQSLGSEAQQYAAICEATTDTDLGSLADDSQDAAVFLASYRLYEQGELGMAEAADLLRRSLGNLPSEWVEGIQHIADAESSTSGNSVTASEALWRWLANRAGESMRQMSAVAGSVWTDPVPATVWKRILSGQSTVEGAKAYHAESMNDWLKR